MIALKTLDLLLILIIVVRVFIMKCTANKICDLNEHKFGQDEYNNDRNNSMINFDIIDNEIVRGLCSPVSKNGSKLLELTRNFYTELDDLADLLEEDVEQGLQLCKLKNLTKVPSFINITLHVKLLQENYSWKGDDFHQLCDNMRATMKAWVRIQNLVNITSSHIHVY
uniref:Uncharacterized protein n=1 Tax=Clastoptera arizonana TaxID=38151 RepID=A0A1B6DY78_9HEMI